ncbi:MAG: hydroxymyristoyl-ACP dehydratase [Bacteroidaceae bacterium]|nr:hydroxymyristoyl-ACP dehydratase [Bacteroidaceae bacterium]
MLKGDEILQLIPQRPPIVMVDTFYGIEGEQSMSGLTVTPDNIFVEDGELQESGIIEHIAQSAAARIGYIFTRKGEAVPLGFIGSVDKMQLHTLPPVGKQLHTTITVVQEVMGITLIRAEVVCDNEPVAQCNMKIFLELNNEEKA